MFYGKLHDLGGSYPFNMAMSTEADRLEKKWYFLCTTGTDNSPEYFWLMLFDIMDKILKMGVGFGGM